MVPLAVRSRYGALTRTPIGTVVVRGGSALRSSVDVLAGLGVGLAALVSGPAALLFGSVAVLAARVGTGTSVVGGTVAGFSGPVAAEVGAGLTSDGPAVGLPTLEGPAVAAAVSGAAPTWGRPVGTSAAQPITAAVIRTAAATSPLSHHVRAAGRAPAVAPRSVSIRSTIHSGLGSRRSGGSSSLIVILQQAGELASSEPGSRPRQPRLDSSDRDLQRGRDIARDRPDHATSSTTSRWFAGSTANACRMRAIVDSASTQAAVLSTDSPDSARTRSTS